MELSSLIGDYRQCESELFDAIGTENTAQIRELDIRMSWIRGVIREFNAESASDTRLQIDFFLDVVTKTTDLNPDVPPMADLRTVIDRTIARPRGG